MFTQSSSSRVAGSGCTCSPFAKKLFLMKYVIGIIVVVLAIFISDYMDIEAPEGLYAEPNGAMIFHFESNGRLTIHSRAGSSMAINNRIWQGPQAGQVTVTSWRRSWRDIYIDIPGRDKELKAFKIDGHFLMMDDIRLRRVRSNN